MAHEVRRVVTGYDAQGSLTVSSDTVLPGFRSPAGEACAVWMMPPAPIMLSQDGVATAGAAARWYFVKVPPDRERLARDDDLPPGVLHESNAVDLVMVVSGEVWLELDGVADRIHLRAGDTLVQRGTKHAWHNPGNEPAVMSCVNFGALRDDATPSRLTEDDLMFHVPAPGNAPTASGPE